jgi:hypothetical protein
MYLPHCISLSAWTLWLASLSNSEERPFCQAEEHGETINLLLLLQIPPDKRLPRSNRPVIE